MNTLPELISLKEPKILTYCLHGPKGDEYFANRKYLNQRITQLQKEYKMTRTSIGEMYKVECNEIMISEMRDTKASLLKKVASKFPELEKFIVEEKNKIYKEWFVSKQKNTAADK